MIRFFTKLTHGHFRRHRLEALLCLLGVALGVAVVVAIDAAVAACVRSFSGAERTLRSFTKMQSTLDDAAFRTFLTEPGQVVLVDALAKRLNVGPGATLRITSGNRRSEIHVVGVVQPTGVARSQINDIVIADL